ncbi:VanW family protein [Bacillus weihaiensis]|uniref:YoaR-like putative peptidoglycan binding domain-containing protein n=1 Tax=Bacillus weihaiensis TaxID=1547283 RepID=A0A1L3MXP8_9BACI|nr:VanW family protein [Bacillus weihaiensis]APH07104.1 hypothetical protein A9C19_13115 [Bacillus weihaiensis]
MKLLFAMYLLFSVQPTDLSENISILHNQKEVKSLHRSELTLFPSDQVMLDYSKVDELLDSIDSSTYKPPINAYINEQHQLVSEEVGYRLDERKFLELLYTRYFSGGPATLRIPLQTLHPRVDSELLSSIRTKQIGYYTTTFNTRNKQRSQNIRLASQAINNHVVFPGEIFSFNSVVGKRTTEKGYLPAPVIVKGELSEGIGGGICQVSSTLFNAVDYAKVDIIERYSHSRSVPYVPPNRDATVSWYGPDFTFRNQHNQPILIQSKIYHGTLSISIFSSDAFE